jgi:16S rRNA (uracil1498-N3)-methyltransferase
MNRFFVSTSDFVGDNIVLGKRQAHQIRNVLRMNRGDRIIVLDNTGYEYEVVLTEIKKDRVLGRIEQKRPATGESQVRLTLYQSLLSRDKFELVLQKCTEVGVSRFVPVITQRSLVRDADTVTPNKLARWQRIITEAAEQSHRGRIPEIEHPIEFEEAVSSLADYDLRLITSPNAGWQPQASPEQSRRTELGDGRTEQVTLRSALRKAPKSVAILIGPEGGFTDEEIQIAQDAGTLTVSLGPRILRTETASIVTAALILYELENTSSY